LYDSIEKLKQTPKVTKTFFQLEFNPK